MKPQNMEEKQNFEFPILSISKSEYDAIEKWIVDYKSNTSKKDLYLYGAGIRGNMVLKLLEEAMIEVKGFVDTSIEKQGGYVKGYKIFAPADICGAPENNYILISPENFNQIEDYLIGRGYAVGKSYSVIKSNVYPSYKKEFFRKENIEYMLFGDCYFTDLDIDDLYGKTMGELAKERLGKENTKVLSIHGMCITGFYYLMKLQLEMGIVPKSVAFIVNVPFCNGIQTKLPQSQHAGLLKLIQESVEIEDEEFDNYVKLAESRSNNISAGSFSTKSGRRSRDDEHVEKLLTKSRYMYEFKSDNENVIYLKKMIELLQKNHIKPVPFIPALNHQVGVDYYGEDFLNKYRRICDGIQKCAEEYGIEILDMSFMLDKTDYLGDRMTKFPNSYGKEKEISLLCSKM